MQEKKLRIILYTLISTLGIVFTIFISYFIDGTFETKSNLTIWYIGFFLFLAILYSLFVLTQKTSNYSKIAISILILWVVASIVSLFILLEMTFIYNHKTEIINVGASGDQISIFNVIFFWVGMAIFSIVLLFINYFISKNILYITDKNLVEMFISQNIGFLIHKRLKYEIISDKYIKFYNDKVSFYVLNELESKDNIIQFYEEKVIEKEVSDEEKNDIAYEMGEEIKKEETVVIENDKFINDMIELNRRDSNFKKNIVIQNDNNNNYVVKGVMIPDFKILSKSEMKDYIIKELKSYKQEGVENVKN